MNDYIENMYQLEQEFKRYSFNMPGYKWRLIPDQFGAILEFTVRTKDTYSDAVEGRQPDILIGSRHALAPFPMRREHFRYELQRAIRVTVMHEVDEWFKCDGVIIDNPHERN